jgi:hypothetical protein
MEIALGYFIVNAFEDRLGECLALSHRLEQLTCLNPILFRQNRSNNYF